MRREKGRKAAPGFQRYHTIIWGCSAALSRHKAAPTKAGRFEVRQAPVQLRAARTLAVMASTEPTPSMWLYFGLPPLAADSFW